MIEKQALTDRGYNPAWNPLPLLEISPRGHAALKSTARGRIRSLLPMAAFSRFLFCSRQLIWRRCGILVVVFEEDQIQSPAIRVVRTGQAVRAGRPGPEAKVSGRIHPHKGAIQP
jgi:hypothetical protein